MENVTAGAEARDVKETFDAAGHLLGLLRLVGALRLLCNPEGLVRPTEQAIGILGLSHHHQGGHHLP